jgi:DNA-binding CsgD family transcriptional regulator
MSVFDQGAAAAAGIDPVLARLHTTWARLLLLDSDHAHATDVAVEGLAAARRSRDDGTIWSASMTLAASLAKAGRLDEATALIDDANRSVTASPSRVLARPSRIVDLLGSYADAAVALERLGRQEEGLAMAQRGAEAGRRLGAPTWGGIAAASAAAELIRVGRWQEADEIIEAALQGPGAPLAEAEVRTARARLRTSRGDLDGAEEDLAAVMNLLPTDPPHAAAIAVDTALAEQAAWRGTVHRGRDAVVAGLAAAARADDHFASLVLATRGLRLEADAAEVARARRNASEATEALERGETLLGLASAAADHLSPLAVMRTRRDAELARAQAEYGRLHGVTEAKGWQNVAALRDELHEPFEGAYARWRVGEALLHDRSGRNEAERVLREAYASARALGAAALCDEISAVARRGRVELETGEQRPAEETEEEPIDRLGLSERELEVLALLAEGRTNRQIGEALFITEKTAGHHVSNILGKLGVSSRVEAAAVAHRAGVVP